MRGGNIKMKIAIIYQTMTGHSKRIANAIAENLQIQAADIKTNPKFEQVDLLFIVGGIYGGKSLPELSSYVNNLDSTMVKKVALLTSSAGKTVKQTSIRDILVKNNIEVLEDEFVCQGSFLVVGFRHPNKADMDAAISFAKKVVENKVV